jgi:hypothetical protein
MAVRGQLYDPSTLTPWESASTDSTWGWAGPRVDLYAVENTNISDTDG